MKIAQFSVLVPVSFVLGFFALGAFSNFSSSNSSNEHLAALKKPNDRAPASADLIVPGFNGKPSLLVNLKFVCSPWLYTMVPRNSNQPVEETNYQTCLNFAKTETAATQETFNNSRIPVKFTYSFSVQPSPVNKLLGNNQINREIRVANANINHMPGYLVTDAEINRVQTSPGKPAIPPGPDTLSVLPNRGGCNPLLQVPPNCNYESTAIKYGRNNGATAACSFYPNTCTANGGYSDINQSTGRSLCEYDPRYCAGGGPNCQMPVPCYCQPIPGLTRYSISNCPFQGPVQANIRPPPPANSGGWNSCWCMVFNTPGTPGSPAIPPTYEWQSTVNTPYVSYQTESLQNILDWIKESNLGPAGGENSITVAVTPSYSDYCGKVPGLYDVETRALSFTTGKNEFVGKADLNSYNYLQELGKAAVAFNCPNVLAHEIGHIFGALHEIEWASFIKPNDPYYELALLWGRDVTASLTDNPIRTPTIMWHTNSIFPYFSTQAFKTPGKVSLSVNGRRNNRGQIIRAVNLIAGRNLEYVPDPKVRAINIINEILLQPENK